MDRPLSIRKSPVMPAPKPQREMIEEFWRKRKEEIEAIEDFGERAIPMTRLKKILCLEKGKMMMTCDTPSFLTKACEIFVQELAFCAWMSAASHHRSIILETDIAEAIAITESYDFLKDILHAFREERNSIPCFKPTKKHGRSSNQPSTSRHPPSNQVPQFHPQFPQYLPIARIPLPLLPTNVHPTMPLPFSVQSAPPLMSTLVTPTPIVTPTMMPLVNHMTTGLGFFGNGFNTAIPSNFVVTNNVVASGVMTHPLQVRAGAPTNIPGDTFYMKMANASARAYDIGGTTNNNINAAPGQHLAIQLDHILPGIAEIASDNIDGQQEQQINLDDGQQEQQHQVEEAILNHPQDAVDGTLDAVVASASATAVGGDDYNVSWDEFQIPADSLISNFWEDIMEVNPTSLPNATTSTDILPAPSDMQDLEGLHHESYLFDDLSPTRGQATGSSKAP